MIWQILQLNVLLIMVNQFLILILYKDILKGNMFYLLHEIIIEILITRNNYLFIKYFLN
jgi:hypothetical protein